MRSSNSASRLHTPKFSPLPIRSRSLDGGKNINQFGQLRGQTPGMDDYLTMTELESVWDTHDSYLGCYDAPQRVSGYDYKEPVEAPTIIKHQITQEHTPVPRIREPLPPRGSPRRSNREVSETRDSSHTPNSETNLKPPAQRAELSGWRRPSLESEASYSSIRRLSPLRPQKPTADDYPKPHPESKIRANDEHIPPITTSRGDDTQLSPLQSQLSPRPSSKQLAEVRNGVVSGVVHPALRPVPYLDSKKALPNCRVASRDAMDATSHSWAYGKI